MEVLAVCKVSIIIPVYNAEDYLARCLDSVCNQTLKDIEIICVNDCSKDKSLEILNSYASKDKRIKVIDCKVNGGESVARNIGIDNATGEYLAFVDNDDVVDLDFYETLYNKAIETNADIVKGEAVMVDFNGEKIYSQLNNRIRKKNSKWQFEYEWWSAIYKHSMIKDNRIRLPEGYPLGGDEYFLHKAIEHCQKLELVDNIFYHWLRREGSGYARILNEEKIISALTLFKKIKENITLLYEQNKVAEQDFEFIIQCCLDIAITFFWRNPTRSSRLYCINYIKDLYNNTAYQKFIKTFLLKNAFLIYDVIVRGNQGEIFNVLSKYKSCNEFHKKCIFAKLRSGIIKNA